MTLVFRLLLTKLRRSASVWLTMGFVAAHAQQAIPPQSIDNFLSQLRVQDGHHNSVTPALAGQGAQFVNYGGEYGVDPRFIVAISGAETSFGVRICTANNAWNWFWQGPCPNSPFDSFASGVHTVSHFMHSSYIIRGYNTIDLIGARYCVTGCENWVSGVTTFYRQMGADVNILTWTPPEAQPAAGQVDPPAAPVDNTPLPERVTLQSVGPASGGWWTSSRSVTVTALVSGPNLLPKTVDLWQEAVAGHARTRLATLSPAPGASAQPAQFTGTVTLTGSVAADLYVAAAFKHGKMRVVRTSTAVPEPNPSQPPTIIYLLLVLFLIITIGAAVPSFRALRGRRKPSAAMRTA